MRPRFVVAHGCFAIIALTIGIATAVAQAGELPDPADPSVVAPALKYESTFSDYQPFREQKSNSWEQVNKEVARNPGMDSNSADAQMGKGSAGRRDMDSMKDMSDKTRSRKESETTGESMSGESTGETAMTNALTVPVQPDNAQISGITGTGVVQVIDKANGKVKLSHDPIAALGWPRMTMFFRLKDGALADQVKEGDKIEFSLEKSASGYVISGWHKFSAGHDMKQMR